MKDKAVWDKLGKDFEKGVEKFVKNPIMENMADIFETITSINTHKGWRIDEIIEVQKKKREEKKNLKKE